MPLIGGLEFSQIAICCIWHAAYCERYQIVQLLEYDQYDTARISRGGKSSVRSHRDVIFCDKGYDWRIENFVNYTHIYWQHNIIKSDL